MGMLVQGLRPEGVGELSLYNGPSVDVSAQPVTSGLSEHVGRPSQLRFLAVVAAGVVALGAWPGGAVGASSEPPKTADRSELAATQQTAREQQVVSWLVCNGDKPRRAFRDIEVVRFYCKTSGSAQTYLEKCKDKEVEMCRKVIRRSNYIVRRCRDGGYDVCDKFEGGVKKARKVAVNVMEEIV